VWYTGGMTDDLIAMWREELKNALGVWRVASQNCCPVEANLAMQRITAAKFVLAEVDQ
jgi:hypothetical protein